MDEEVLLWLIEDANQFLLFAKIFLGVVSVFACIMIYELLDGFGVIDWIKNHVKG